MMKTTFLYQFVIIGFLLLSCENDKEINYQYEATILGQGIDCGETYLIDLTRVSGDTEFTDGTYYADNLLSEFKVSGLKIQLNCRGLNADEIYACTHLGPYYPHVFVINSKIAD